MPTIQLTNTHPRMTREARTLEAMIGMYCRDQHGTQGETLCADCAELLRLRRRCGWRSARSRSTRPPAPNARCIATSPPAARRSAR